MAGPVARIGDVVFFPKCGVYPIVTGNPLWLEVGSPVAHIGSFVPCPKGAWVITGKPLVLNSGIPISTIGDIAIGPKCKVGIIISGSPLFLTI